MSTRRWLLLIVLLFLGFGMAYSLVVPPFETPDEPYHFAFARHLAQGGSLPVQAAQSSGPWEQEGSQPPLYYAIVGLLTRTIDQSDFDQLATRNPHANIGNPLYPGNKNFMLYSGASHLLAGANLALHVGRWFSLLLGALTVLLTGLTARFAFPKRKSLALLAALWVAVIPQYAFLSGSLTNDALVTMTSALGLFWMARLATREVDRPVRWWEWTVLGLIVGAAALSKLQGLGLGVLACLLLAGMAWQRRSARFALRALVPLLLPPLLVAGWWYLRNITLYDDWTGVSHLLTLNGRRAGDLDLADWWLEFRGLRYSFWGLFGWFNLLLPTWLYTVLDAITLLAMGGALYAAAMGARAARARSWSLSPAGRVLLLCATWSAISFALLVYWTLRATGSQGRLLFPALSALAILLVYGLDALIHLLPARARGFAWAAPIALLIGSTLYTLVALLPAAYWPASSLSALPPSATPVNLRFGEAEPIDLLGVETPMQRVAAGAEVPVRLYLRAPSTVTTDYPVFLQLLDEKGDEIANVTTHAGWGRNPTTLWQAGAIQQDAYQLRLTRPIDDRSPLLARLYVGFIDPATEDQGYLPLPARSESGEIMTPFISQVTVVPGEPPDAGPDAIEVGASFGDVLRIDKAALPTSLAPGVSRVLTATLLYEALGAPTTDYTAFLHILDAQGNQVAGFDAEPAAARFPTSAWQAGDRIRSDFVVALPDGLAPGEYGVWTGLYETRSGGSLRLPVTDAAGAPSGDGVIEIARVRVE